jgi:hypothetical protein
MKIISIILILMLILFTSCKKDVEKPYTLKFYGDAYEDIGYSVSALSDGYVFAGQLTKITRVNGNNIVSSNKNMGIIKTGWNGNIIWKVSAGGKFNDWGSKIYQNDDGSLICVGTFSDTTTVTSAQTDVFAVKVSTTGIIEWQKTYGGAGNQTGKDIVKITDGYLIMGSTDVERQPLTDSTGNKAGNKDIFLLKIKDDGDLIESFAYGYPGNDVGTVIKTDIDGNNIILGTTDRSEPGQDKNNLIMIRINSLGYATETRIIGGTDDEYAADMEVLTDGYLLAYTVVKDAENQQIYVKKLKNDIYAAPYFTKQIPIKNSSGNELSAGVNAISKYKTGSFVFAGYTGVGSLTRMLIFEMDAEGNEVAGHEMITGSTGVQTAYDVLSGDDEYIIAVGKNSYDVNSMICLLKFRF